MKTQRCGYRGVGALRPLGGYLAEEGIIEGVTTQQNAPSPARYEPATQNL